MEPGPQLSFGVGSLPIICYYPDSMSSVTYTLPHRYVDLQRLSALLQRLFGAHNFIIRVSPPEATNIVFPLAGAYITHSNETTMSPSPLRED